MLKMLAPVLILAAALCGPTAVEAAKTPHKPHVPHTPKAPKCKKDARKCSADGDCCNGNCCNGRCTSDPNCVDPGEQACGGFRCNVLAGEGCCDTTHGLHCQDLFSDTSNCGACGTKCGDGQECSFGVCKCPADKPDQCAYCTNTQDDAQNCGGCGNVCADDEVCQAGHCVDPCPPCSTLKDGRCQIRECECGVCDLKTGQCPDCEECPPCEHRVDGQCVPVDCECGSCNPDTGACESTCGQGQICCNDTCLNVPRVGDSGRCCNDGSRDFACASDEQCAGPGCCEGGSEVCTGNGTAQCCDAPTVCAPLVGGNPSCCIPGWADPRQCCDQPGCLPAICCRPQ
jgi:hypothetical protein